MKQLFTFLAVVLLAVTTHAQVGIGTISPHNSAALEVQSTTKGLLLPRLTKNQIQSITSPAEGLLVYCNDCTPNKGLLVFNGDSWQSSDNSSLVSVLVEVTGAGGRVWMDRNIGASRVATSSADSLAYGDLYQWGRLTDGHQSRTSSTTNINSTTDIPGHGDFILEQGSPGDWRSSTNDSLWQGVTGINNPCPNGFRLPTQIEFDTEAASWGTRDSNGAYNSVLRLPVAGNRLNYSGALNGAGTIGYYWTSNVVAPKSIYFQINSSGASSSSVSRSYGFSVRCIKN